MSEQDTTPENDDRPLIGRAIDIASPIVEGDIHTVDIAQVLAGPDVANERLLAHAFFCAMDRLADLLGVIGEPPKSHRCGWCVAAAGGTDEAWRSTELMDDAAVKAHTLTCEHNPLVARIRELDEALGDALELVRPGSERDRLVAILAKPMVLR